MKVVIATPLSIEFNEARNQLGLVELSKKSDIPRIAEKDGVTLVCTGIGKVNTVMNLYPLLYEKRPDIVIDSGTCGGIKESLEIFDIVVSYKTIEFYSYMLKGHSFISDPGVITGIMPTIIPGEDVIASIEDSVVTDENRKKLEDNGATIVTWESSSLFSLCNRLGIPVISMRCITDLCNDNSFKDFKNNRIEACRRLYIAVRKICTGI